MKERERKKEEDGKSKEMREGERKNADEKRRQRDLRSLGAQKYISLKKLR